MGQDKARAVKDDMLLTPWVLASARRVAGDECPKKGQTFENRRSEVTCMILDLYRLFVER